MKRFRGFLIKEFYHIFRDRRTLMILFGMPIAQILLFGFAITNEIKDAKIAIHDKSKDHVTREITRKILSSGYFILSSDLASETAYESSFHHDNVKAIIIFEPGFATRLSRNKNAQIQVLADASEPNVANTIVSYISGIAQNYTTTGNGGGAGGNVKPEVRMYYNPGLKGVFMFVPGVMTVILMLVSAMMTSISIAREKELGTMEVLLVSPLNPLQVVLGKVAPYLLLSFINAFIILGLGVVVFGMPIQGNILLLAAETILFVITALALGIMISTVAKTQQTAMMASLMGLMLPTIILSGFIFPIESMPKLLQYFSNIVPAKWFITIIKSILLKGTGFEFIWKETIVLVGMTMFFIAVSIKKYPQKLQV